MVEIQVQFLVKVKAYFLSLTTLTKDEDKNTGRATPLSEWPMIVLSLHITVI